MTPPLCAPRNKIEVQTTELTFDTTKHYMCILYISYYTTEVLCTNRSRSFQWYIDENLLPRWNNSAFK